MTGALIIAQAGHRRQEAEDRDLFVPMIHMAGTTVIKRQIRTLKKAGITSITVVARPEHVILERHLAHLAVSLCLSEGDMIREGLKSLADCDQVLLLPGNVPLFLPETVGRLLETEGEICMPRWESERGALVLLRGEALRRAREDGLMISDGGVMDVPGEMLCFIPVEDRGVVLRLNETEDIRSLEEYARQQKDANELGFQVKLVLYKQEDFFGPGIADFLVKIEETGSILAACQEMNMSYSKGWKMLGKIEEEMGVPFLIRKNGGRGGGFSQLTPEGKAFVRKYYAFLQDVSQMAENFFEQYYGEYL